MSQVSMVDLFKAGAHFGHQKRYWNPKMGPYIFGVRNGIHIINLEKSVPLMQEALNFASSTVAKGGTVLFVGTKRAASDIIQKEATRCGMPYVNYRWLGGMLTNFKTIKQSIKRLRDLESMVETGKINSLTKREALMMMRDKEKLEQSLGGIKDMRQMPDVIFVIDVNQEDIAVQEANKLHIPVIGVVDTNSSLKGIDYIIPGNDDAIRAIELYAQMMADTILEAKATITIGGNSDYQEVTEEVVEIVEDSQEE